jgi:DNA-binding phage protein
LLRLLHVLERNRKWNYAAIAKDLGISIEEVKACHPAAHPQNHDMFAIAAQFGIDLSLYVEKK